MNIFQRASKQKLRYQTSLGTLSVEDLWDLPLTGGSISLDDIAKHYNKLIKESDEESFVKESKADPSIKLRFDIVIAVIESKISDKEKAEKIALKREKKQKILEIMSRKKDEELEGKSYDELEALLEED